jgi:signal transduction histidine kinase
LIFELRPESLQTEGLVAALERQIALARTRHGLAVTAEITEEPDIPVVHKEALYRIAQEALHNIVKHAGATDIRVRLTQTEDAITIEIGDNGRGFDPAGEFPGHFGLQTMHERAAALGGMLAVESAPGVGTRVTVRLPAQG